nr:zinc finger MYM-type protein 1-like [Quercus suber]
MDKFVIRKPRRLQDSSSTQDADLTQDSSSTQDADFTQDSSSKQDVGMQSGGDSFVTKGFNSWNKKEKLDLHVGGVNSAHNQALKNGENLMKQNQHIQSVFVKQSNQDKIEYRTQLNAIVDCIRFLLHRGLAFRGHDESDDSSDKGNFLELLQFLADHNDVINEVLQNTPKNSKLTHPDIQKDIVNAVAYKTTDAIIEDLGSGFFSILVDESRDISIKEQMAVVLRYVDKKGIVTERFLGLVHVADTSALSLKAAIEFLFNKYALSLSRLRGQGYDGASNMQGEFNGLKTLILKENKSAFYVHCFAHQLQLTLVAVANKHTDIAEFFSLVNKIVTIVGASCKRREFLRNAQLAKITEASNLGELESGQGLNQETSLKRAGDTCWGSHYRTILNLILMFSSTVDVLEMIEKDSLLSEQRVEGRYILSKHDIPILNMEEIFVVGVRPRHNAPQITNLHHYRVDLFFEVIDLQLQELNNRFSEVTTELLLCMACLNPSDSFLAFDIQKLTRLAKFYPSDFSEIDVLALDNQLQTYIVDMRSNDEFLELKELGTLLERWWRQRMMLYIHWYIYL